MNVLAQIKYLFPISGLVLLLWLGACTREEAPALDTTQQMTPEVQMLLQRADLALSKQNFEMAFALADSAEARAPLLADISFLRGRTYAELLRLDDADSAYYSVLQTRPSYPGVWHNLGNTAFRRQEYTRAIEHYRKELALQPDARPWRGIGKAYVELGQLDSARFAFEKAIALDDNLHQAYFGLALLLEDMGDFEGALKASKQALEREPSSTEYQFSVGANLFKSGKTEEAIPYLRSVTEAWPWHQAAHYNLAQALVRSGKTEEARQIQARAEQLRELQSTISNQENAVRVQPENPFAHAGLASVLRRAARYDEAMHAYNVALYLDPGNLEFRNNVAVLHLLKHDTTAAIQTFEQIVRRDTTNVAGWFNLGSLYAMSGQPQKAKEVWQVAQKLDPGNEAIQSALGRLR